MTEELPARLRVAAAYKGLAATEAGALVGVSKRQWNRYLNGEALSRLTDELLLQFAEATGVPGWFMLGGWDAEDQPAQIIERLEKLENEMQAVLRRLAAESPPPPPGADQHPQTDVRSSPTTDVPRDSREAPGDRGGTER